MNVFGMSAGWIGAGVVASTELGSPTAVLSQTFTDTL